jgi:hypothetical protein
MRDVKLKLTLMHHAEECSDRVKFTVVQVTFDPDPVRLGYLLRPRRRIPRVVRGTVLPHEVVPDITLRGVGAGTDRVEIGPPTNPTQAGTFTFRKLLSPQGTYEDPVGVIAYLPDLVNRNLNAAIVKAWKNGTFTPPFAPLGSGRFEQEIKVEIGGHEIGPGPWPGFADGSSAISGRRPVSTINPDRVQIIWPTP